MAANAGLLKYWPALLVLPFLSCARTSIPPDLVRRYAEAKTLYLNGELEQALSGFRDVHRRAPRFWANAFMLGKTHFFREDYAQAREVWERLLRGNPNHLDTAKWLARLYLQRREPARAEGLLERAVASSSEDPELLVLMGKLQRVEGNYAYAIELFRKAAAFRDKLAEAHLELAELYREFGLEDRAAAELGQALSLLGPESALYAPLMATLAEWKKEGKR